MTIMLECSDQNRSIGGSTVRGLKGKVVIVRIIVVKLNRTVLLCYGDVLMI
jgi:hypothetical protein